MVVLPGAMLHVPRGAWHGVRNTGTGALQVVWISSPPGLELFFRELSRLGASPSTEAVQELAQRHRIELRPATPIKDQSGQGHRRRGHRGGRRHRGGQAAVSAGSSRPAPVSPATSPAPSTAPASPSSPPPMKDRGGPRRRRRGGARRHSTPALSAPPAAQGPVRPRAVASPQRPVPRHHRRRVKEVYMGGRWVQVEGDGPVIAPSSRHAPRRGHKPDGDDDPPRVHLSVPL